VLPDYVLNWAVKSGVILIIIIIILLLLDIGGGSGSSSSSRYSITGSSCRCIYSVSSQMCLKFVAPYLKDFHRPNIFNS
jgi:hypothetical protein